MYKRYIFLRVVMIIGLKFVWRSEMHFHLNVPYLKVRPKNDWEMGDATALGSTSPLSRLNLTESVVVPRCCKPQLNANFSENATRIQLSNI
jgi:hypothetical protein